MAPELAQADDEYGAIDLANGQVDVYSYGILLWTMATTEDPYHETSANPFALMAQVVAGKRPPIDGVEYTPRIPNYLADLMARCWDADPLKRPTFHSVVSELRGTSVESIEGAGAGGATLSHNPFQDGGALLLTGNGGANLSGGRSSSSPAAVEVTPPPIPAGYASFRDFGAGRDSSTTMVREPMMSEDEASLSLSLEATAGSGGGRGGKEFDVGVVRTPLFNHHHQQQQQHQQHQQHQHQHQQRHHSGGSGGSGGMSRFPPHRGTDDTLGGSESLLSGEEDGGMSGGRGNGSRSAPSLTGAETASNVSHGGGGGGGGGGMGGIGGGGGYGGGSSGIRMYAPPRSSGGGGSLFSPVLSATAQWRQSARSARSVRSAGGRSDKEGYSILEEQHLSQRDEAAAMIQGLGLTLPRPPPPGAPPTSAGSGGSGSGSGGGGASSSSMTSSPESAPPDSSNPTTTTTTEVEESPKSSAGSTPHREKI